MAPVVLYDACVLYPAPLRDLLMQLAVADLFQARWTDEIHDEWTRNVLANRADIYTLRRPTRCRQLMDEHVPDCLITEYEALIPTLTLPDPDGCHVLAAAIHGGAGLIITFNLSDFPASILERFDIERIHPRRATLPAFGMSIPQMLELRARSALGGRPPYSLRKPHSRHLQGWRRFPVVLGFGALPAAPALDRSSPGWLTVDAG